MINWHYILLGVFIAIVVLLIIRISEITTRLATFEKFVLVAVTQEDLHNTIKHFTNGNTYCTKEK
jgi:hypothetical protein